MKILRDNWKGILAIILLIIIFSLVVNSCNNAKDNEQPAFNEAHLKEDKAIRRYDSLLMVSTKRYEEYLRCSALNAEYRKKEVAKIEQESKQDENNIISQPDVADDELLRKISRQYKEAHSNK